MKMSTADHPDSARSWAIAAAAFVINIMLSGISRTTGLIYVALIDTYGITRMEANLPFTLRNIVRNLLGKRLLMLYSSFVLTGKGVIILYFE